MDDLTGVVLDGRYRVIESISEGAMGVVYRAERVNLGRIVAIKVLHDELPAELSSRKRFETEAKAMAKLEHPHCAAVIDVGIHGDKPFVVMDYVAGETLREVVAAGPLPIPRAVEIVRQVLSGLAHAHEVGIIHRDIKPANIVVSQKAGLGDHVKILDFGLARITDAPKLTTGIVVGTPAYMAPEQIRGTMIDARADLYSAGVLLFELLTAAKPFVSEKDDPVEVCSMHLKVAPPTLGAKQPGIEFGALEAIVAKALAKKAEDRYASAVEFAAALDTVVPRRATAPVIPIPVATESGWTVAASSSPVAAALTSAPVPVPAMASGPTTPTSAPVPVPLVTTGPTAPVGVATGPNLASLPPNPPAPTAPTSDAKAPRPARTTKAPPAPFASQRPKSPTVKPVFNPQASLATAAAAAESIEQASPPAPVGGLPADFDLSIAIPRDPLDARSPAFDLSVAIPSPDVKPTETTVLPELVIPEKKSDTKLGLGTVERAPEPKPPEPKPEVDHDATAFFQGAPPAGPSPLAAADAPAIEPVSLPNAPVFRDVMVTKKQWQIIGIALGGVLLIAIIIGTCRGGTAKEPAKPNPEVVKPEPPRDPADEQFARASELIDDGKAKAAIDPLIAARSQFPKDPRFSYLLGRAYFGTKQASLGLKQFRETIALDGTYRADPDLIKVVLAAFNSASEYPAELGAFLREDIGAPARQYLEETAATHPSSKIRTRAKTELTKLL